MMKWKRQIDNDTINTSHPNFPIVITFIAIF